MKAISRIFIFFELLFIFGCSIYNAQSFNEISKATVNLEAKNFTVRKLGAQGSATSTYIFGIPMGKIVIGIATSPQDIQARALKELHKNFDGKGSCVFHNINSEWTNYGIPFLFIHHQNTITADIYEFNSEYIDYARRIFRQQY
jgi:hypothetical protein